MEIVSKWKVYSIRLLIIILIGIIGRFGYIYVSNLPKVILEYQGVKLNDSMSEVIYSYGDPNYVLSQSEKDSFAGSRRIIYKEEVEKSPNKYNDFDSWAYEFPDHRMDIDFESKSHKVISISCYRDIDKGGFFPLEICPVNGIDIYNSEDEVKSILGKPDKEYIDGVTKILVYQKLNMRVLLIKRKVYYIVVQL